MLSILNMYYMNILKNKIIIRSLSGGTNKRRFRIYAILGFIYFLMLFFWQSDWRKKKMDFLLFARRERNAIRMTLNKFLVFQIFSFILSCDKWSRVLREIKDAADDTIRSLLLGIYNLSSYLRSGSSSIAIKV